MVAKSSDSKSSYKVRCVIIARFDVQESERYMPSLDCTQGLARFVELWPRIVLHYTHSAEELPQELQEMLCDYPAIAEDTDTGIRNVVHLALACDMLEVCVMRRSPVDPHEIMRRLKNDLTEFRLYDEAITDGMEAFGRILLEEFGSCHALCATKADVLRRYGYAISEMTGVDKKLIAHFWIDVYPTLCR